KVLQRLLRVAVDGRIGPATVAAAVKADAARLVGAICDERLAFLQGLSTWSVFGNGWGRRVREGRAAPLAPAGKASGSPGSAPPPPARGGGGPAEPAGRRLARRARRRARRRRALPRRPFAHRGRDPGRRDPARPPHPLAPRTRRLTMHLAVNLILSGIFIFVVV